MRFVPRRWLVVLLCVASLFNGFAAAATAPAAQAPCEMAADHDSGNSPCGDCGGTDATCLQQCAALCACVIVTQSALSFFLNVEAQRVALDATAFFTSHAGPPAFQPPR